jgi:predicted adenine nucleotide alpha hydrolase (AANH) superfamily ATPase
VNEPGNQRTDSRPGLFLHVCCAPCSAHVIDVLSRDYRVGVFFYNPNIYPPEEYQRRAQEVQRLCRHLGADVLLGPYDATLWARRLRGRSSHREGGPHCAVCFWMRLRRTATEAGSQGYGIFATTLTVSPHKDAGLINRLGEKAARGQGVRFHQADFKKQDGYVHSCQLSRELGLYRQDYCGCVHSLRERRDRKKADAGC